LKTHDQTFTMKYLGLELFFERHNKTRGKLHQLPFVNDVRGGSHVQKKKKLNNAC
jgi:hypothetical protein